MTMAKGMRASAVRTRVRVIGKKDIRKKTRPAISGRRERMFAEGTADEVGDRVRSPSDREGEEEKARAVANGVKAHCKGKRKGNEEKRARGDASRGEAFDKGTAGEER